MKNSDLDQKFLKFHDDYADAIFRHCYFRVFNREKAKDLTQDVFMKLWKYIAKGKKIEYPQALLFKMANNIIIDHHRKKKVVSLEVMEDNGFQPSQDPTRDLAINIDAGDLVNYIHQLKDHHREVLLLRYVQGFKPKDIAELLNISVNIVSVRITRAKNQLRKNLKHSEQNL